MSNEILSFEAFLWVWLGIAIITCVSLFFVNAPYGRYNRSGWGMQINNKLGWVVMELVSPAALLYFFLRQETTSSVAVKVFISLWVLHYVYRSIFFPLKLNTKGKTIPLAIVLMAICFNSVNGYINGYYFGQHAAEYSDFSFTSLRSLLGLFLFAAGFYIHVRSDNILIDLRKSSKEYVVPNKFLFKRVASPNYLGEITQWLGFAVLTGAFSAWCFWAWTVANLLPRAVANFRWYQSHFSDYPKNRKILIPGIF